MVVVIIIFIFNILVLSNRCVGGDEQLCGAVSCTCCEGNDGGFADYIRIQDSKFAFSIPDALDSARTAPLLCGGQTVWTPLVSAAFLEPLLLD